MSLFSYLREYISRDVYPFHMPGHKGNEAFFLPGLQSYDLTELPETDVLGQPAGILKEMQEGMAAFFGADESFFLVNGASAGVAAAICTACGDGDVLYAARNGHTSVFHGMALAGAVPRYFLPQMRADGLAGGVAPDDFDEMPWGAAAYIVSPTYEGYVSDVTEIARRVHARGGVLIADEAHGAHFAFHERFPSSALSCGADIVIQSLHKTLPVPGQCALVHVKGQRVDRARLRFYINAMQTTSPSYMLMAAADYALQKLWGEPRLFDEYIKRLGDFRQEFAHCLAREWVGQYGIFAADAGKLLFALPDESAIEEIAARWATKYKIQVEMARGRHILAMTSVADTDEGFARLACAAAELEAQPADTKKRQFAPPLPKVILSPREALRYPTESVPADAAVGRIAGELVAPCPPGIIQIAPGEEITVTNRPARPAIRCLRYQQ